MSAWTIAPADPPLSGAGLHLILTPPEPVADLLGLDPEARAAFWHALDQAARIAHQKGWPGYSWAVTEDRPGVVQVVAGGKAALDLTRRDGARPAMNDTLPCPSESAKRRHAALGQTCRTCQVGFEPLPGDQLLEREEAA